MEMTEKNNEGRVRIISAIGIGKICVYEVKDGKYIQTLSTGIYKQPVSDITVLLSASKELFLEAVEKLKAIGFKKVSIYRYHPNADYMKKFNLFEETEMELIYLL